jgi:hypothetical protein
MSTRPMNRVSHTRDDVMTAGCGRTDLEWHGELLGVDEPPDRKAAEHHHQTTHRLRHHDTTHGGHGPRASAVGLYVARGQSAEKPTEPLPDGYVSMLAGLCGTTGGRTTHHDRATTRSTYQGHDEQ